MLTDAPTPFLGTPLVPLFNYNILYYTILFYIEPYYMVLYYIILYYTRICIRHDMTFYDLYLTAGCHPAAAAKAPYIYIYVYIYIYIYI